MSDQNSIVSQIGDLASAGEQMIEQYLKDIKIYEELLKVLPHEMLTVEEVLGM